MKLYHGTTEKVARKALESGLLPRKDSKAKSNWKQTVNSNNRTIYLTDAYALYFAMNAVHGNGENPAVIEVDLSKLEEELLVPDEDALEQGNRGHDFVQGDMHQRTMWYRRRLREFQWAWQPSLNVMGTCGYMGAIPAEAVSRVAVIDQEKQIHLCIDFMDPTISIMNYQIVGAKYKGMSKWIFDGTYEPTELEKNEAEALKSIGFMDTSERLAKYGRDGITIIGGSSAASE